jgi:molybdenum cofactor cytidylyltransferase
MRGLNKLLVPVRGEPALSRICGVALRSELSPVIVVLGHERAKVRESLEDLRKEHATRLRFVVNVDYLEGRTSSIRAAVRALPAECDAVMFLRGDQPWVSETLIGDLVRVFREKKAALAFPVCEGRKGSPTIFAGRHFGRLLDLRGDRGTLDLAEDLWDEAAKLEVEDARCLTGVDTREDLDRLSP